MIQLILHLFGDYLLQSDWMANGKTSKSLPCFVHVCFYSAGFLLLKPSLTAFAVIFVTHFFIDRFRLAKYLAYAKNFIAPPLAWNEKVFGTDQMHNVEMWHYKFGWQNCKATGYPSELPPFMTVWLMILADNTLHLSINYLALRFL